MSETKKRFRPSATAYRQIEKELTEANAELVELKRKYELLSKQKKELEESSVAAGVYNDLKGYVNNLYNENNNLKERLTRAANKIEWLCKRSLWQRLVNYTDYREKHDKWA
jgi:DNA repair ATPase RecN